MKHLILVLIVSCMSISGFAQKRDFVRLSLGGGLKSGGFNIQTEYGRQLQMIEIGADLNIFSNLPFLRTYGSSYYETPKEGDLSYSSPGLFSWDDVEVDGNSILSLNLNANIDVLWFLESLRIKHALKLGGGIGGYTCISLKKSPANIGNEQHYLSFNSGYHFQYILSAQYEYTLSKNVSLGIYFDYLKSIDDYPILGAHVKRYF